jgi:hypothetical protein
MVLFQLLVEILMTSVENVYAKDLADRTWVPTVPICGSSLWSMTTCPQGLLEKALSGVPISLVAEHGVKQIAILINGTIHGAPRSLDSSRGLLNVPAGPCLSATPHPQLISYQGSTSGLPVAHRLMRKHKTAFQEDLGKIT